MNVLRSWAWAILGSIACLWSVQAQTYPQRSVRMVVPFAAGGGTDAVGRSIAESMSVALGQQVVIDNIGGAGGMIGAARAAQADADGYTVLLHQPGLAAGATLYPQLNLKPEMAFVGVGLVSVGPLMIVGRSSLPVSDIRQLKGWAVENKHQLTFGHPGAGSMGHFCGVLARDALDAPIDLVAYRGGGPALADTIAGHVDLTCVSVNFGIEQTKSGTLKGFGITDRNPSPAAPGMPPLGASYPKLDLPYWHALFAPAGTPRPIIDTLNAALQKSFSDPKVLKMFELNGMTVYPANQRTPEAATALLASEIVRLGDIVRANKINVAQ